MDYIILQKSLEKYPADEVNVFINYLKDIETSKDREGKPVNPWFQYVKYEQLVDLYKKVSLDGLFIDGQTITLQFKGKLMVSYNFQAYKNKLLKVYPETLFDLQNVFAGDTFSFRKESGKVLYMHTINNPFENKKQIIGCYCIIKNKRGDFIETLNIDEITKMKNSAKTSKIWDAWFTEMTLKSVIKRACKRHFNDITTNIETLDNENYEPETAEVSSDLKEKINNCDTLDELQIIYDENKGKVQDEKTFISLLSKRKSEIKKLLANENS